MWELIGGKLRGETAGEIVIPSRHPSAQVGDPRLIKPGCPAALCQGSSGMQRRSVLRTGSWHFLVIGPVDHRLPTTSRSTPASGPARFARTAMLTAAAMVA